MTEKVKSFFHDHYQKILFGIACFFFNATYQKLVDIESTVNKTDRNVVRIETKFDEKTQSMEKQSDKQENMLQRLQETVYHENFTVNNKNNNRSNLITDDN